MFPRTREGSVALAEQFRRQLIEASHLNDSTFAFWIIGNEQKLTEQFLQSGEPDPYIWHADVYEHDMGLIVADGTLMCLTDEVLS